MCECVCVCDNIILFKISFSHAPNNVLFSQHFQQLQELLAEKQIVEQQRDIANTERERVITESVNLKKKLELMNSQRQRDAKDLNAMRHVKEKAFQVMSYVDIPSTCIILYTQSCCPQSQ